MSKMMKMFIVYPNHFTAMFEYPAVAINKINLSAIFCKF